jgi:hypothetical protein
MIRRISVSLIVALLAAAIASAQAATTVRGRVLAIDGTPYPSAAVTLKSSAAATPTVYTGTDGMFYVSNVAPGAYSLHVKTSRSEATFKVTAKPQAYSDLAPVNVR